MFSLGNDSEIRGVPRQAVKGPDKSPWLVWLGERPDRPRLRDPFKTIIDSKEERKTYWSHHTGWVIVNAGGTRIPELPQELVKHLLSRTPNLLLLYLALFFSLINTTRWRCTHKMRAFKTHGVMGLFCESHQTSILELCCALQNDKRNILLLGKSTKLLFHKLTPTTVSVTKIYVQPRSSIAHLDVVTSEYTRMCMH